MKIPRFRNYRDWRAFDVESTGEKPEYALQPWSYRGELRSFAQAWFTEEGRIVSRVTEPRATRTDLWAQLKPLLGKGKSIVGWNVAFDAAWCIALGLREEVMQTEWLDAMLLWKHWQRFPESDIDRNKRKPYSLKDAVREFIPKYGGYEGDVQFHGELTDQEWQRLLKYNRADAAFTLRIAELFWNKLRKEPQRLRNALVEAKAIPEVADHYIMGLFADMDYCDELRADVTAEREELGERLAEHGVTETIMASPKQLTDLLYEDWGLPVLVRTDKGAPSANKDALDQLSRMDDRCRDMARFRELGNLRTKFIDKILESCDYNEVPVTHPTMNLGGTYTGRATFSSYTGKGKEKRQTGFAIHQMSGQSRFRRQIIPPSNFTVVEFDAAGQEFRWMALASEDETMLALCEPGEDPHGFMGAEINPRWEYRELQREAKVDEAAAKDRKCGKVSNLSCVSADTVLWTPHGPKRIVDIRRDDLIWDGTEFVPHAGVVYQGVKDVITYQGLTATPDHRVSVQGEWVAFEEAAARGWRIDDGRVDVAIRAAVCTSRQPLCTRPVLVRDRVRRAPQKHSEWQINALPQLREPKTAPPEGAPDRAYRPREAPAEARAGRAGALRKSFGSQLQELWWAGHKISLRVSSGLRSLGTGAPSAPNIQGCRHRSTRQQRPLRAGQLAVGYASPEPEQSARFGHRELGWVFDAALRVAREPLFLHSRGALCAGGPYRRGDHCPSVGFSSGETQGLAEAPRKAAVYDVLNCGPRNRFVADGLVVHNCQYRIGKPKFQTTARVQYGLVLTEAEASHYHDTYHRTYPGVKKYWRRQIRLAKIDGRVQTFAGRTLDMNTDWTDQSRVWMYESAAINFPIQGTGADQKFLAIAALKAHCRKYNARFYFELHDGIYYIVPTHCAMKFAEQGQKILNNLPYGKAWGYEPPIPLPWDVKMSDKSWGDMEEVEF